MWLVVSLVYSISIERNRYATESCIHVFVEWPYDFHACQQPAAFSSSLHLLNVQKERLYSPAYTHYTDTSIHPICTRHVAVFVCVCIQTRAQLHCKTDHSTEIITIFWMAWMICVWVRAIERMGQNTLHACECLHMYVYVYVFWVWQKGIWHALCVRMSGSHVGQYHFVAFYSIICRIRIYIYIHQ